MEEWLRQFARTQKVLHDKEASPGRVLNALLDLYELHPERYLRCRNAFIPVNALPRICFGGLDHWLERRELVPPGAPTAIRHHAQRGKTDPNLWESLANHPERRHIQAITLWDVQKDREAFYISLLLRLTGTYDLRELHIKNCGLTEEGYGAIMKWLALSCPKLEKVTFADLDTMRQLRVVMAYRLQQDWELHLPGFPPSLQGRDFDGLNRRVTF